MPSHGLADDNGALVSTLEEKLESDAIKKSSLLASTFAGCLP